MTLASPIGVYRAYVRLGSLMAIAVSVVVGSPAQGVPEEGSGRICVAPLPERAREVDRDRSFGPPPRDFSYLFSVRIDDAEPVAIPDREPVLLEIPDLETEHRVEIRDGDELIESFEFRFSERGANLCLTYTPWYQTWQLDPPRSGDWRCQCREVELATEALGRFELARRPAE